MYKTNNHLPSTTACGDVCERTYSYHSISDATVFCERKWDFATRDENETKQIGFDKRVWNPIEQIFFCCLHLEARASPTHEWLEECRIDNRPITQAYPSSRLEAARCNNSQPFSSDFIQSRVPKSNCARRKLSTVGACDNSLLSRSLYRLRVQWNQLRCCVGAACDDETIVSWLQRWVARHVYARTANNSTLIIQTLWSHLIIFLLARRDDFMTNCLLLHLWIPQAFLS